MQNCSMGAWMREHSSKIILSVKFVFSEDMQTSKIGFGTRISSCSLWTSIVFDNSELKIINWLKNCVIQHFWTIYFLWVLWKVKCLLITLQPFKKWKTTKLAIFERLSKILLSKEASHIIPVVVSWTVLFLT